MARTKKEHIDDKVKQMDEEKKEKWLPLFKAKYGDKAKIEELEFVQGGIHGCTYRVLVKNPKGKKGEHYLRLLPGSDDPAMIDGILTKAGQNYVDFWSDYGAVIGDAY